MEKTLSGTHSRTPVVFSSIKTHLSVSSFITGLSTYVRDESPPESPTFTGSGDDTPYYSVENPREVEV